MKRSYIFSILTIASFFLGSFFFASPTEASSGIKKTYHLTFSTQMPLEHLVSRTTEFIARRADELSGGQIKIRNFPGGSLFRDLELAEAVMSGGCSMGTTDAARWAGHVPAISIFNLPFIFTNKKQLDEVSDEVIPIFDEVLYPKGAKILGLISYGDADAIGNNKRQLRKPRDLEGLKLRSYNILLSAAMQAGGGVPVVISAGETYTALQRGTIDGASSGSSTFVTRKWMEVLSHVTIVRGMVSYPANQHVTAINRNLWESMETAAQNVLLQACKEGQKYSANEVIGQTEKDVKILKDRPNLNVYFIPFGSEEWKEWRQVMFEKAKAKYLETTGDLGKKILEIVKKHE